jgi:hypothetical protein
MIKKITTIDCQGIEQQDALASLCFPSVPPRRGSSPLLTPDALRCVIAVFNGLFTNRCAGEQLAVQPPDGDGSG